MTISYPLSLPTATGIAKIELRMNNTIGMYSSPFTGEQQAYRHQGCWWSGTITLPVIATRAYAETWIAWLASLQGRYGTFLIGDPTGSSPRGVVSGSPLVKGADQTGFELDIDALAVSTSNVFRAGDYIQIGTGSTSRLYKVLADANSNGSGEATLDIWPRLRESPADNAAVTYSSPKGVFRLAENVASYAFTPPTVAEISFEFIEAI